tara:strand:- start:420 stop:809 length:390 start_codon:yes stop_codon:yes gene_type:complete
MILFEPMWSNIRLSIYSVTAIAGLIWPFYFIAKFVAQVQSDSVRSSIIEIAKTFIDGAWATPTSGFVSADTAVLLIGIFAFYVAEGKRLQMKLWGIYFPLTFLTSLAFSFGAFMFMREKTINSDKRRSR